MVDEKLEKEPFVIAARNDGDPLVMIQSVRLDNYYSTRTYNFNFIVAKETPARNIEMALGAANNESTPQPRSQGNISAASRSLITCFSERDAAASLPWGQG